MIRARQRNESGTWDFRCQYPTLIERGYAIPITVKDNRGCLDGTQYGTHVDLIAHPHIFRLLALFAVQHSVMARQWFKRAWTRVVPASVERSTYVLFSCAALLLLFWKWEPMGAVIWNIENGGARWLLQVAYGFGWLTVFVSTLLINHFDLFGLRQVWLRLIDRPYAPLGFRTPGPYRYIRHPLYLGWFIVFWSAPVMTVTHLVFALATTGCILVAIQFEERDLIKMHGEYAEYRRRVPMILPLGSRQHEEVPELSLEQKA